jgi:hypothetical protein
MFNHIKPDKIERNSQGQYLFTFAEGKDINKLPIGSEYYLVTSPNEDGIWRATCFQRIYLPISQSTASRVARERVLAPHEIAHFKALINIK